jgi:TolA-binding protein
MRGPADRCPDDLLARSRGSSLSPVERRALDAHLGVCDLCRAAVVLGALHDELPDLPSDDDAAVVARLAGRVVARATRRPARARGFAVAAGVALLAVAGVAAAWVSARRLANAPAHIVERASPPTAPQIASIATAMHATAPVAGPPAASDGHRRRVPQGERAASARSARVETPEPDGPDRLFAQANATRGAGDLREAAERYEQLERRYPDSPEANVSLVSAGDLLARLGDPAAALDRFDRYLARNVRGALAPEALFGRARCLRELGRRQDEADAWRALVASFPGSLYDRTARRRLNELRADGPTR